MKNIFKKHKFSFNILLTYNIITVALTLLLYFVVPLALDYLPETYRSSFEVERLHTTYDILILSIMIVFLLITNSVTIYFIKSIISLEKKISKDENWKEDKDFVEKVRLDCYRTPYYAYMSQIMGSIFVVLALLIVNGGYEWTMLIKITIIIASFVFIAASTAFMFSRKIFAEILNILPFEDKIIWRKIPLKNEIMILVLPIVIMTLFSTTLVGYAGVTKGKSNILKNAYAIVLDRICENNTRGLSDNELIQNMNNIDLINPDNNRIIIYNDGSYKSIDNMEVSDFIIQYTLYVKGKYDGRVMDRYGEDIKGIVRRIYNTDRQEYCYIGIIYNVSSMESVIYFAVIAVLEFLLILFVLRNITKDVTNGLLGTLKGMKNISESEYDSKKETRTLKVISNNEIGELVIAFNKIQDITNKYIDDIHEKQEVLVEQDRLASLGQLIGGIAHNLKTPIMSISGNLQAIQDLVIEYNSSIGDKDVNDDDHREIAKDMQEVINKAKLHLAYMSDIITATKGQASQFDEAKKQIFGIFDVINRTNILMRHELKKAGIEIKEDIDEEVKEVYMKGNINSLVQVINNVIQNAIYSYNSIPDQIIDLRALKEGNNVCFEIQDYGMGMPDYVKEKLFKEMITTKGKNGTGLGLYMSYSTIKGKFNGKMSFESEEGKGTTFRIIIPISE